MTTNTIVQLPDPQGFAPDPLTELLRSGAQRLIEQAVEAELAVPLDAYASDKTGNVLNAMPKAVQVKTKGHLHDIWQAETRVDAEAAFDFFVTTYGVKYDKAVAKLTKDRDVLLAFYDFPAEHWKHIRTTNPIESTFATVRHRTGKTKGCLSRKTGLAMAFKLMMSAQTKWRKLDGASRMPEIIQGIEFKDGIKQLQKAA